ncbi:hypothetical protein [Nocardia niigatensis]
MADQTCPDPIFHRTHRYCPYCAWTEQPDTSGPEKAVAERQYRRDRFDEMNERELVELAEELSDRIVELKGEHAEAYLAGYSDAVIGGVFETVAAYLGVNTPEAVADAQIATAGGVAEILALMRDVPAVIEGARVRLAEIAAAAPTTEGTDHE